jgi:hypothetical protein
MQRPVLCVKKPKNTGTLAGPIPTNTHWRNNYAVLCEYVRAGRYSIEREGGGLKQAHNCRKINFQITFTFKTQRVWIALYIAQSAGFLVQSAGFLAGRRTYFPALSPTT